jgi:hypothetical protein
LESRNRWLKAQILVALQLQKSQARLPARLLDVLPALCETVIPEISQTILEQKNEVPKVRQVSSADLTEARALVNTGMLVRVAKGVYVCKQRHERGELQFISKETATKAARLYRKRTWNAEEYELLSQLKFITPSNCFPCVLFSASGDCYHRKGVDLLVNKDTNVVSGTSETIASSKGNRRGRKRKQNTRRFEGQRWKTSEQARKSKAHKGRGVPSSDDSDYSPDSDEVSS